MLNKVNIEFVYDECNFILNILAFVLRFKEPVKNALKHHSYGPITQKHIQILDPSTFQDHIYTSQTNP